jgi:hypothetical protein
MVESVKKVIGFQKEKLSPSKKVEESAKITQNILGLINEAKSTHDILQTVGVVSTDLLKWLPVFSVVNICWGAIGLGLQVKSMKDVYDLDKKFNDQLATVGKGSTSDRAQKKKVKELLVLTSEKIAPLLIKGKVLSDQNEVIAEIKKISQKNVPKKVAQTAKNLIEKLQGRVKILKRSEMVQTTLTVIQVAAAIFVLIVPPLQFIGVCFLVLSATTNLVTWGVKFYLVNKDPFKDEEWQVALRSLKQFNEHVEAAQRKL